MKRVLVFSLVFSILGFTIFCFTQRSSLPLNASKKKWTPPSQKGMTLGLFSKDLHYSYLQDLKEMNELGVSHVSLFVSWYQKNISTSEIRPRDYDGNDILTTPDSKLIEVINQAHSLGMKVTLFPVIRLEEREGNDWRGLIKPQNLEEWWKSYNIFIKHYAKIAQQNHVEIFSIGSELLSREKEEQEWSDLIQQIRSMYSGQLIYSSNWDHYTVPVFWQHLDYIGITAYNEVASNSKPNKEEVKEHWKRIQKDLLGWMKKYPKQKLVITEIGYTSIDGTCQYPWNYYLTNPIDLDEQVLCYEAFIESWQEIKNLEGVYFFAWWGEGGKYDRSYTPRHKPVAEVIRQWYKPVLEKQQKSFFSF